MAIKIDVSDRWEEIQLWIEEQQAFKIAHGIPDQRVHPTKTNKEIWEDGLKAEHAFSKISGLPVDKRIHKGTDRGYDFILPGGIRLDVKYTDRTWGDLYFAGKRNDHTKADIFLLATVDPNNHKGVIIPGRCWITSEGFASKMKWKKIGQGNRLAVVQKDLNPISEWKYIDLEIEEDEGFEKWLEDVNNFAGSDKAPSKHLYFCQGRKV